MKTCKVKCVVCNEQAKIPEYKTIGASGMDISSTEKVTLGTLERTLVHTGLRIQLPEGYEAQIRPRSGMSIKYGITLVNCIGTIDSDYTGEILVPVINLSNEVYTIEAGERIAQMVITEYTRADIQLVDTLEETERGAGGFGSTGK